MKKQRTDHSNTGAVVGANVVSNAGSHVGANTGALVGAPTSAATNAATNAATPAPSFAPTSAPTSEPASEPASAPASIGAQYGDYRYLPGNCHLVLQFLLSGYEVGAEFLIQSAGLARSLSKNSESVRRALALLADEGLLAKEAIRKDYFQGLKVQLLPSCLAYQQQQMKGEVPTSAPTSDPTSAPTRGPTRAPASAPAKHIEEEEDINSYLLQGSHPDVSLSDSDLEAYYPHLLKCGFTSKRLRDVANEARRIGTDTSMLVQSLRFAEYYLENPPYLDLKGGLVRSPYHYLRQILVSEGFFPMPPGYVSPQLQLLKQLEEQEKQADEARRKMKELRYESWKKALSEAERKEFASAYRYGPDDQKLKTYWLEHVEPHALKDPIATSTHEQFDHGPLVQTSYTEQSNGKHNGFN